MVSIVSGKRRSAFTQRQKGAQARREASVVLWGSQLSALATRWICPAPPEKLLRSPVRKSGVAEIQDSQKVVGVGLSRLCSLLLSAS